MKKSFKLCVVFVLVLTISIFGFCFSANALVNNTFSFYDAYYAWENKVVFSFDNDTGSHPMKINACYPIGADYPNGYFTQSTFSSVPSSDVFYNKPFVYHINFKPPFALKFKSGDFVSFKFPIYIFSGFDSIFTSASVSLNGSSSADLKSDLSLVSRKNSAYFYELSCSGYVDFDSNDLTFVNIFLNSDSYNKSTWYYIGFGFYDLATYYAGDKNEIPVYNDPDSSAANEQAALEDQLRDGTASGMDQGNTFFNDLPSLISDHTHIGAGLLVVGKMFNKIMEVSWLHDLIYFALILGFLAFVLGTSFIVVKGIRNFNSSGFKGGKHKK